MRRFDARRNTTRTAEMRLRAVAAELAWLLLPH
jgi:hypothetical protein